MLNPYSRQSQVVQALALCVAIGALWWLMPIAPLPLVLAAAPVAAWVVFRQPFLICLCFVLFSFFRIHEAVPVLLNLKIPQLLALGSLGGLVWLWVTGGIKTYLTYDLKLLLAFACVVALSVVFSSNRPVSLEYFNAVFSKIVLMTLVIAWLCQNPTHFRLAIGGILMSGLLIAWVAISNKLAGIGLVEGTRVTVGRNIDSVLGDPNDLAVVLLFPLSFAVALVATYRTHFLLKVIGLISVVMICWAILATQSRGGLLGVMAVFGAIGWQRVSNKALLAVIGVVGATVLYVVSGVGEREVVQGAADGMDASSQGRLYAWQAAFYMALAHPFTGIGIDMFVGNYFTYTQHWDGRPHAVHSSWFGVLGETGFIGLGLFIAINVSVVRRALRMDTALKDRKDEPITLRVMTTALLAGLSGNVVSGTFLTHAFLWPLYILLALTVALARYIDLQYPDLLSQPSKARPAPHP